MPPTDLRTIITSAPMSAMLIALNVTVFVAVGIESRLVDVLALPPDWASLIEQPWTLLTVFFTAEALAHLGVAVLAIGLFGVTLERVVGRHVLGMYLVAGLAGSLAFVATAAATGFDEPSVGASAAFLGLVGALAASPTRAWGTRLPLGKIVVVMLVVQLVAPAVGIGDWVSSAAHIAGVAVGLTYGYLLRPRTIREQQEASIPAR